jgi:hypothetical protein
MSKPALLWSQFQQAASLQVPSTGTDADSDVTGPAMLDVASANSTPRGCATPDATFAEHGEVGAMFDTIAQEEQVGKDEAGECGSSVRSISFRGEAPCLQQPEQQVEPRAKVRRSQHGP